MWSQPDADLPIDWESLNEDTRGHGRGDSSPSLLCSGDTVTDTCLHRMKWVHPACEYVYLPWGFLETFLIVLCSGRHENCSRFAALSVLSTHYWKRHGVLAVASSVTRNRHFVHTHGCYIVVVAMRGTFEPGEDGSTCIGQSYCATAVFRYVQNRDGNRVLPTKR